MFQGAMLRACSVVLFLFAVWRGANAIERKLLVDVPQDSLCSLALVLQLNGCIALLDLEAETVLWQKSDTFKGPLMSLGSPLKSSASSKKDLVLVSPQNLLNDILGYHFFYVFQPEAAGYLFEVREGAPLKKLSYTLAELVHHSPFCIHPNHWFFGSKKTKHYAISLSTGQTICELKSSGSDVFGEQATQSVKITEKHFWLTKNEYSGIVYYKMDGFMHPVWSLSYAEIREMGTPTFEPKNADVRSLSDVNGEILFYLPFQQRSAHFKFDAVVISSFQFGTTSTEEAGIACIEVAQISRYRRTNTELLVHLINDEECDGVYALPADVFCRSALRSLQQRNPHDLYAAETDAFFRSDSLAFAGESHGADALMALAPGRRASKASERLPRAVTRAYAVDNLALDLKRNFPSNSVQVPSLIEGGAPFAPDSTLNAALSFVSLTRRHVAVISLIVATLLTLVVVEAVRRATAKTNAASVSATASVSVQPTSSLYISDEILGYGSHGTVVFKGTFEGRKVAVKRVLSEYFDVAGHEVELLQQSDHHPNVVRYFYMDRRENFHFIVLEFCVASLFDVFTPSSRDSFAFVLQKLAPRQMIEGVLSGVEHLHQLNIIHRDLKPQNILITDNFRVVISDFGLCRKLSTDQQSFFPTLTFGAGAGTAGWRAPECIMLDEVVDARKKQHLLSPSPASSIESEAPTTAAASAAAPLNTKIKIGTASDVFSVGCVIFFILTGGKHPFGEAMHREHNIVRGAFNLQLLDPRPEAQDLVRRMICKGPILRLSIAQARKHPFFWSADKKLGFIQDFSDRVEIEDKMLAYLSTELERHFRNVCTGSRDWSKNFSREVLNELFQFRTYNTASLRDLLRFIRNKKNHYYEMSHHFRNVYGALPDGFLAFFTSRFPRLIVELYDISLRSGFLKKEQAFCKKYLL